MSIDASATSPDMWSPSGHFLLLYYYDLVLRHIYHGIVCSVVELSRSTVLASPKPDLVFEMGLLGKDL